MNRAQFNRRLRQLHLGLGIVIGAQIGLWFLSGLFMVIFPIEQVRGEHLRADVAPEGLEWQRFLISPSEAMQDVETQVHQVTGFMLLGEPVWRLRGEAGTVLIHAGTGGLMSPLEERVARRIAVTHYAGADEIIAADLLQEPPQEYGRAGPVWRIEFGPGDPSTFYVDASTGEVRAVRTLLWRTFDFMWGLHIMDWDTRENFNSWWLKMSASLAFLLFLAGAVLVALRLTSWVKSRSRNASQGAKSP